jgi:hypothetical protein
VCSVLDYLFHKQIKQVALSVGRNQESGKTIGTKYDMEKFSGANDFGLWRTKMEAILVQQGCAEVIKGQEKMSSSLS